MVALRLLKLLDLIIRRWKSTRVFFGTKALWSCLKKERILIRRKCYTPKNQKFQFLKYKDNYFKLFIRLIVSAENFSTIIREKCGHYQPISAILTNFTDYCCMESTKIRYYFVTLEIFEINGTTLIKNEFFLGLNLVNLDLNWSNIRNLIKFSHEIFFENLA